MRPLLSTLCVCLIIVAGGMRDVEAADPQPYRVEFAPTGNAEMDANLKDTSELQSLRTSAPVSPFGLIARARGDVDRLKTVLESYGYYDARIAVKIDGTALDAEGVSQTLAALPKGTDAHVQLQFDLGPLYHLRHVELDGNLPELARAAFDLKSGDPAVAARVLGAGSHLLAALQDEGYAFAKVDPPVAYQDATDPVLDVSFQAVAGERVNIGAIHITGLKRLHAHFVRAQLLLHSGEQYNPAVIERARHDLLGLGAFATVTVQLGTAVDASGGVPVTFDVRERPLHAVNFSSAYSTDLGGSATATWTDRDLLGNAEQLTFAASVINLGGGSATTGIGYDTNVKLALPDFGHRDQSLQFAVGALKQSLLAYDQTATTTGVTLSRKLSSVWSASVALTTAEDTIRQIGLRYDYTLVAVPVTVSYDSTHLSSPLDDPRHGMRDSVTLTPTHSFGNPGSTFVVAQIKLAGYLDLHPLLGTDPGRSILALRALAGVAEGASEFGLPPDQRFYAGGSGTIRGYAYQEVGPQYPYLGNTIPVGGNAIVAGGIEFRQRIGTNWGFAVFSDAGGVSESLRQLSATQAISANAQKCESNPHPTETQLAQCLALQPSEFRIGLGAGIRYYTPIGPVRVDIAVPTEHYITDQEGFQVYVGLGQAF